MADEYANLSCWKMCCDVIIDFVIMISECGNTVSRSCVGSGKWDN
jgi:hypothetical protein